jgi:dienelactone hydrolase
VLLVTLCLACATASPTATPSPVPTPQVNSEKATFKSEDGTLLVGELYLADGDLAVVLAHQGAMQTTWKAWQSFAELAATNGVAALPFNFRRDFGGPLDQDVLAAIRYLRSRGYERIACIGASMGGTSCLKAALTEPLVGIGIIGSMWTTGGVVKITPEELATLTVPKLFVTTDKDRFPDVPLAIKQMFDSAPEPKQFKQYSGTAHGTEIFSTPDRDDFRVLLLGFLTQLR